MSDSAHFWLEVEHPNNLSVLTGLIELSAPLSLKTFRSMVEKRVLHVNSFLERIIKDPENKNAYYWVKDNQFDIRTHIQMVRLKNPQDITELQNMMTDIMSVPLDRSKPLWQFILVDKYQTGSAIITRTHQALMDRVDLIKVLMLLSDKTNEDQPKKCSQFTPYPTSKWKQYSESLLKKSRACVDFSSKAASTIMTSFVKPMTNPFYMIEKIRLIMGTTTDRVSETGRILFMNADSDSVLKKDLGKNKHYAWSKEFSLKEMNTLAKATNSTVNVIYISTLTGTIKQYLKHRKNPVDYREIRAITPVDMRMNPGEYSGIVRFGLIPFELPVHIDDPLLRINEVKRRIQNIDLLPDAVSVFGFLTHFGMSIQTFTQKIGMPFSQKSSLLMTNTQGPEKTLFMNHIPVNNIMFWLPRIGTIGLGTTILSYNQKVRFGIVCDAKQIPDPQFFIDAFELQLTRLTEIVSKKMSRHVKSFAERTPEKNDEKITPPIAVDNVAREMFTLG